MKEEESEKRPDIKRLEKHKTLPHIPSLTLRL